MPIPQMVHLGTFLESLKLAVELSWVSLPRQQMQPQALQILSMLLRPSLLEVAAVYRARQKREIQPRESLRLRFRDPTLEIFWISNLNCLAMSPRRRWTILSLTPLHIQVFTSSRRHWPRMLNSTSQLAIAPRVPKDLPITTKRHIAVVLPQQSIQQWREIPVGLRETGNLLSAAFQLKFCINKKLAGVIQILLDPPKRFNKMQIIWEESM